MLDPKSISRLNQHETSKKAAAELRKLRPDWTLTDPQTTDDLAVMALLLALWEDEGEQAETPEAKERAWLVDRLAEMSEAEISRLLDATDVTGALQDVTGSMMEALREASTEVVPDFWP